MPARIHPHRLLLLALAAALAPLRAPAQPAPPNAMPRDAHPTFAVATIRLHDPTSFHQGFQTSGNRFTIQNESVQSLIAFAYAVERHQIAGAPDWLRTTAFDITGRADIEGEPSLPQMQEMIQKLLADRFALRFHREQRVLPVYAIRIAKGGPKLPPAAHPTAQPDQQGQSHAGTFTQTYTSVTIADFILGMQFMLDRPLVDQTGLTGRYDFTFSYTPNETAATSPNATSPNAAPGIFTALPEQLGLKLEATKAPTQTLVIDHVAQPTPN
jgi:uncharacterized protein (TIGR03435 family)